MRRANHDDIPRDDGGRMETDVGRDRIHFLIGLLAEVDHSAFAKPSHRTTRLGIKRNHDVPGSDIDDAFFVAVAPVRQATSRQLPRREFSSFSLVDTVDPLEFARLSIQCHDRFSRTSSGVQHAIDNERC